MKIIIIGAGIAGFSTYLLFKKHLLSNKDIEDISIHIYEAYDIHKLTADIKPLSESTNDEPIFTPVAIGSALGLAQNGINVLRRLDEEGHILQQIKTRGNSIHSWRMSNARGWTLANANLSPKGQGKDSGSDDVSIMIARQDLWEVMRDEATKNPELVVRKKVTGVTIGDGTRKSIVNFEDGTSEEADLVVGADGLRSVLRRDMFTRSEPQQSKEKPSPKSSASWFGFLPGTTSPKDKDYITPTYEGLAGFGGFLPTSSLVTHDPKFDPKVMNIVFGPNGFFGYGCISSPPSSSTQSVSAWWSTFSSRTPYPYRTPTGFNSALAVSDLVSRHKSWRNSAVQHILSTVRTSSLTAGQFYPTWTTPELPSWYQGTVVLVGDAAHALQPSSGQGASQALEDAEALALLLRHYLARHSGDRSKGIEKTLEQYELLRKPRVHKICERARRMGGMKSDMGFVMEMFVYAIIWVMSMFHDKYMDELVGYDLPKEVEKIIKED